MAWAEVAVAATDLNNIPAGKPRSRALGPVVLAALALPGAMPVAHAETAPEHGVISLRYLRYQDQQEVKVKYPTYNGSEPDKLKRITVKSPSVHLLAPLGTRWSLEASGVRDDVSGATPKWFSDVSGATQQPAGQGMSDLRRAGDVKISRHFDRAGISVGASHSTENDYKSTAFSVDGRVSSADNNTTFSLGFGSASDKINPVNDKVKNETKRTREIIAGVTQALNANNLVQLNLSYANGRGYYSDPYKYFDNRPDRRRQAAALVRWNTHLPSMGSTVRSSYRYYRDNFGIVGHTGELAWVQPTSSWFLLTPSVRYHSQSSANFYYDAVLDSPSYPEPLIYTQYMSADHRLSAFGAVTLGLKAELRLSEWTADVKYERYEQRSDWRVGGQGSPNLDVFSADSVQFGVSRKF